MIILPRDQINLYFKSINFFDYENHCIKNNGVAIGLILKDIKKDNSQYYYPFKSKEYKIIEAKYKELFQVLICRFLVRDMRIAVAYPDAWFPDRFVNGYFSKLRMKKKIKEINKFSYDENFLGAVRFQGMDDEAYIFLDEIIEKEIRVSHGFHIFLDNSLVLQAGNDFFVIIFGSSDLCREIRSINFVNSNFNTHDFTDVYKNKPKSTPPAP